VPFPGRLHVSDQWQSGSTEPHLNAHPLQLLSNRSAQLRCVSGRRRLCSTFAKAAAAALKSGSWADEYSLGTEVSARFHDGLMSRVYLTQLRPSDPRHRKPARKSVIRCATTASWFTTACQESEQWHRQSTGIQKHRSAPMFSASTVAVLSNAAHSSADGVSGVASVAFPAAAASDSRVSDLIW
jgi:hypothetical protein